VESGHIFIINEIMYFHVVLARSLICTLRSPQVMNGTQNRCLFLLTPFVSLHETQHLTPAVGVFQRTNCSHLWFVYRKLKSVTLRTSGLSVRSFFLRSAPAVKGIWIPHGTISLTANIDPEYSEVQRSTAKRRMLTAPWQPQSFAPEITGVRIKLSRNRITEISKPCPWYAARYQSDVSGEDMLFSATPRKSSTL